MYPISAAFDLEEYYDAWLLKNQNISGHRAAEFSDEEEVKSPNIVPQKRTL